MNIRDGRGEQSTAGGKGEMPPWDLICVGYESRSSTDFQIQQLEISQRGHNTICRQCCLRHTSKYILLVKIHFKLSLLVGHDQKDTPTNLMYTLGTSHNLNCPNWFNCLPKTSHGNGLSDVCHMDSLRFNIPWAILLWPLRSRPPS